MFLNFITYISENSLMLMQYFGADTFAYTRQNLSRRQTFSVIKRFDTTPELTVFEKNNFYSFIVKENNNITLINKKIKDTILDFLS